MPPLIFIDCLECNGERYFESEYGAVGCEACDATGRIEVCESCLTVPEVVSGYEVCGCVVTALKAA